MFVPVPRSQLKSKTSKNKNILIRPRPKKVQPKWDDTCTDLTGLKATSEELQRRKERHLSHNLSEVRNMLQTQSIKRDPQKQDSSSLRSYYEVISDSDKALAAIRTAIDSRKYHAIQSFTAAPTMNSGKGQAGVSTTVVLNEPSSSPSPSDTLPSRKDAASSDACSAFSSLAKTEHSITQTGHSSANWRTGVNSTVGTKSAGCVSGVAGQQIAKSPLPLSQICGSLEAELAQLERELGVAENAQSTPYPTETFSVYQLLVYFSGFMQRSLRCVHSLKSQIHSSACDVDCEPKSSLKEISDSLQNFRSDFAALKLEIGDIRHQLEQIDGVENRRLSTQTYLQGVKSPSVIGDSLDHSDVSESDSDDERLKRMNALVEKYGIQLPKALGRGGGGALQRAAEEGTEKSGGKAGGAGKTAEELLRRGRTTQAAVGSPPRPTAETSGRGASPPAPPVSAAPMPLVGGLAALKSATLEDINIQIAALTRQHSEAQQRLKQFVHRDINIDPTLPPKSLK